MSVGSAIGVSGACEPARKWIRAGERRSFSSCGRAVSGGIWYARATKEDGAGRRAVSGGKWCAADDGEERRKKKRGGRRVEDGEESALNLNSTSTTTRIYRPSECK